MHLKKANAVFGLMTIILLLAHAGYQVAAYILFIYNPMVTKILAWCCMAAVCTHAILGMSIMMFAHDGSALGKHRKENRRTILQRGSAIGILVMVPLHMQCYALLKSGTAGLVAAEVVMVLFFGFVFTHVATSLSNALVTLGLLESPETKKKIDRGLWVLCGICFFAAAIVIGRTYVLLAAMDA